MNIQPFESKAEHLLYCKTADVSFEEGSVGFKIFTESEMLGLVQVKFVGDAAYFLSVKAIDAKISKETLANFCLCVVEFLVQVGVCSLVFPVQDDSDRAIAEILGFDRVSETLYVFDLPEEDESDSCTCGEEHCHHRH